MFALLKSNVLFVQSLQRKQKLPHSATNWCSLCYIPTYRTVWVQCASHMQETLGKSASIACADETEAYRLNTSSPASAHTVYSLCILSTKSSRWGVRGGDTEDNCTVSSVTIEYIFIHAISAWSSHIGTCRHTDTGGWLRILPCFLNLLRFKHVAAIQAF